MQQASKWRVKVVCLSAADVEGTLNAANSAKFWVNDDRTAELNAAGIVVRTKMRPEGDVVVGPIDYPSEQQVQLLTQQWEGTTPD